MTATKHVTLWCDYEPCEKWLDLGLRDEGTTRLIATRAEGWVLRGRKDFCCADHAAGRPTELEAQQAEWRARHKEGSQ